MILLEINSHFLDPNQSGEDVNYLSIPSPMDDSVTADFAIDAR